MKFIKLYIVSVLTIFLILMSWNSFYSNSCLALISPVIVLLVISQGYIEANIQERICIKKCFFNENSIIATILTSRILVILIYTILSILMTISLMHGVIEYGNILWTYLAVHIALVILLYGFLNKVFEQTLKDNYRSIFVREWAFNISALFLVISYIYLEFEYGYLPSYLSDTLSTTIINASNSYESSCKYINYVLKVKIEIDSFFWWMISENSDYFSNEVIKSGIWFGFLFFNSLALLGVSKFIVQTAYLLDRLFNLTGMKNKNE